LQIRGITLPWLPVLMGSVALPASAYFSGAEGLLFAFVVTAAALLVYRCLDPAEGSAKSIFAGIFVLAWIPFLISFALVILRGSTGPTTGLTADVTAIGSGAMLVAVTLLLVVANDTFGYLLGAFFGKHPMAPKISPKKSWEGFAGSIGGAMIVAILCATLLLHLPWWAGIVLAVGLVTASTAGDLAESMVKRELGIKDMSSILPGHGGVMDRLDSILFAAPMAFILFSLLGALPA
ncbi:MAG TPA: phosphatidate cytidylyltransferase, partial [Micrococcaceae bacterium]